MKKFILGLLYFTPILLMAQFHEDVFPNESGTELLDHLVDEYKTYAVLPYSEARDYMYGTLDKRDGKVYCVYTDWSHDMPPNVDPSSYVYDNGMGINCEHTYPQNKGASSGFAKSDLHHLFPTRADVNTDRGNLPFGEINDSSTDRWYYNGQQQSFIPSSNIDLWSEWNQNVSFEPREDHKGNVARAMMYFYTMYKSQADAADPDFFEGQRETLCQWHMDDPVDQREWDRNNTIATIQGKKNPFVLDCSLAHRTYCQGIIEDCVVDVNDFVDYNSIEIYPNPAKNFVEINVDADDVVLDKVLVYDAIGRKLLIEKNIVDSKTMKLNFNDVNSNLLFIVLTLSSDGKEYNLTRTILIQ